MGTIGRLTRNSHETGSGHCIDRHCIGLRTSTLPPIAAIAMSTATRTAFSVFMSAPRMTTAHRGLGRISFTRGKHRRNPQSRPKMYNPPRCTRVAVGPRRLVSSVCAPGGGGPPPAVSGDAPAAGARAVTRAGSRTRATGGKALALHKGGEGGTKIRGSSVLPQEMGGDSVGANERSVGVHPCIDLLEALMTSTSSCSRRACAAPLGPNQASKGCRNPISVRWRSC